MKLYQLPIPYAKMGTLFHDIRFGRLMKHICGALIYLEPETNFYYSPREFVSGGHMEILVEIPLNPDRETHRYAILRLTDDSIYFKPVDCFDKNGNIQLLREYTGARIARMTFDTSGEFTVSINRKRLHTFISKIMDRWYLSPKPALEISHAVSKRK